MSVFQPRYTDKETKELKVSKTWWYEFTFAGTHVRASAKTTRKTIALEAEKQHRLRLERAHAGLPSEKPADRIRTVSAALKDYLDAYKVNHRERTYLWAEGRAAKVEKHFGGTLLADLTPDRITGYMKARLAEGAGNRTVNMELEVLSRAIGSEWRILWPRVKRLEEPADVGKPLSPEEEQRVLDAAARLRSPYIFTYLKIALETGMRAGEIRMLRWEQVEIGATAGDSRIIVGKSKTAAGAGRAIPMTAALWAAVTQYAGWYAEHLGAIHPEWYMFPFSSRQKPVDPTRPVTTLKTAWAATLEAAGLKPKRVWAKGKRRTVKSSGRGKFRMHDARHTFITKLAEADVSEMTMKALAGHVSTKMLERYSHVREEAKRAALNRALAPKPRASEKAVLQESLQVKRAGSVQ